MRGPLQNAAPHRVDGRTNSVVEQYPMIERCVWRRTSAATHVQRLHRLQLTVRSLFLTSGKRRTQKPVFGPVVATAASIEQRRSGIGLSHTNRRTSIERAQKLRHQAAPPSRSPREQRIQRVSLHARCLADRASHVGSLRPRGIITSSQQLRDARSCDVFAV